jgi:Spy/CpxP family protein refolding chaperone
MKMRALQFAALALMAPAALAAQGGGMSGGNMARMASMHPFAMEAPPEAEAFAKAIGLNAEQKAKYANLRAANIKATQAVRDSIATERTKAREAMQAGEREGGMAAMRSARGQTESLQRAAESFDSDLAFVLTPEQQTKYDAWKQQERDRLIQERRAQFGRGGSRPQN